MSMALAQVQRVWPELLALPELPRLGLLVLELPARLRRAFPWRAELLRVEALLLYPRGRNRPLLEELASPSSAWLHLPATVELAACFPRPS